MTMPKSRRCGKDYYSVAYFDPTRKKLRPRLRWDTSKVA